MNSKSILTCGFPMSAARAAVMALALLPGIAGAYPGGTPDYQTDVAPFCSSCHSSVEKADLAGAPGDRAEKELAGNKHLALIASGAKPYDALSETDRARLVELIKAVDANSTIEMDFPPQGSPGETFQVTVRVQGGGGPVVGVGLVDRPHRGFARAASSTGGRLPGAPPGIGPDGEPPKKWLARRPERSGRNITYVNIIGWKSDAEGGKWAKGKVIYTITAPEKPGNYPLVGVYWYGTEKATPLSTRANPVWGDQPLGGFTGKSGRVKFSKKNVIIVK